MGDEAGGCNNLVGETRLGSGGVQACEPIGLRTSGLADVPEWAHLAREVAEYRHAVI